MSESPCHGIKTGHDGVCYMLRQSDCLVPVSRLAACQSTKMHVSRQIHRIETRNFIQVLCETKWFHQICLCQEANSSLEAHNWKERTKDWKVTIVIPIHKSDASHATNYHPISITSIPCKIFEHNIYFNTIKYLDSNNLFAHFKMGLGNTFPVNCSWLALSMICHQTSTPPDWCRTPWFLQGIQLGTLF